MTAPGQAPRTVALAAGGAAWETAVVREVENSQALVLVRRCMDVAELLTDLPYTLIHHTRGA